MTRTLGSVATALPAVAVWPSPAYSVIVVGLPVRPVAVKVTGGPPKLELVALRVLVPAAVPSVQLPTVAMPEASLTALPPVT